MVNFWLRESARHSTGTCGKPNVDIVTAQAWQTHDMRRKPTMSAQKILVTRGRFQGDCKIKGHGTSEVTESGVGKICHNKIQEQKGGIT